VLKKIQVTAAPNVGTPALFFLVQNRHTRWAEVWLIKAALSDEPMDKSLAPLHGRCGPAAFL
jgi:hypothetical protein